MSLKSLVIPIWILIITAAFGAPRCAKVNEENENIYIGKVYKRSPRSNPFKNIPKESIKQFEKDHSQMVQSSNNVYLDYTKWEYLTGINTDEFCAKYYSSIHKERKPPINKAAKIFQDMKTLIYITPGLGTRQILVLKCTFHNKSDHHRNAYHITNSSEPYLVYAIDPIAKNNESIFHIVGQVGIITIQKQTVYEDHLRNNPFKSIRKADIQLYENEHFKMVQDAFRDKSKWINGKNLKDYCNNYYKSVYMFRYVPQKTIGKIYSEPKTLTYVETGLGSTKVVTLQCNFGRNNNRRKVHYMTESPKLNHIYALGFIRKYDEENFCIIGEVPICL